ncbi:MAG: kinase/pyrophosphorylase [Syntrophomonadaceae bacterium]|nr:kinase/pyrophosphorylase [Syntrophomonadaceae bacterium]
MGGHSQVVYIVSDSIGETAELVVRAAASQFNSGKIEMRRVPNVTDTETLEEVIRHAAQSGAAIAYTLVVEGMAEFLRQHAEEAGVPTVDVLGPVIDMLARASGIQPRREPGLLRKVDELYFRRVEAIEFAVRYDDGKDPRGITLADIVLIGVSRTSKTPLSMYLAHKRLKVANIPLVPEVTPPEELFAVEKGRVIGLTVHPDLLSAVRRERLKTLGLMSDANYASPERVAYEISFANNFMKRLGCPVIDVSNRAVEETASKILEIYYRRLNHV